MNKAKKYIYPFVFSLGFLAVWVGFVTLFNKIFDGVDYGVIELGILVLFAYLIIGVPIYCMKYGKLIVNEKNKIWLAGYNTLVIIAVHLLGFDLSGETTIAILFILWVLLWNALPLLHPQNDKEEVEKDPKG